MNLAVFGLLLQQLAIPAPQGYVSDFAGVLDPAAVTHMTAVIEDLKAKTGGEIAVVTWPDLQGREASDLALQIGRAWGVGNKGNPGDPARNRGIVILLVPRKNHRPGSGAFWIATGTGSEGFVTDAASGRIRDAVLPQLGQEDYGGALVEATQLVAQRFADEFHVALDPSNRPAAGLGSDNGIRVGLRFIPLLFAALVLLAILSRRGIWPILLASAMSGRRNRWGGGWGGGGFGGFGGGFGGGGGGGGFGGFGGGGGFSGGGGGGSF
jgi:uncharacterized protein